MTFSHCHELVYSVFEIICFPSTDGSHKHIRWLSPNNLYENHKTTILTVEIHQKQEFMMIIFGEAASGCIIFLLKCTSFSPHYHEFVHRLLFVSNGANHQLRSYSHRLEFPALHDSLNAYIYARKTTTLCFFILIFQNIVIIFVLSHLIVQRAHVKLLFPGELLSEA